MTHREEGRLLLVDDDRAVLRAYESVLGRRGWTLETAQDGREAKELIEKKPFDVIISDINMPGYSGLTFVRGVRERDLDVPVILVTGTPSVDTSIRAIEYSVFRYLIKPVSMEVLVDVVSRAARLHQLARLKRRALESPGSKASGSAIGLRSRRASSEASSGCGLPFSRSSRGSIDACSATRRFSAPTR